MFTRCKPRHDDDNTNLMPANFPVSFCKPLAFMELNILMFSVLCMFHSVDVFLDETAMFYVFF